jgi:hypothetical protein
MSRLPIGFALLILVVARGVAAQDVPVKPAKPGQTAPQVQSKSPASTTKAPTKGAKGADHLDLETTVVSGNRDLPKVLYIVPWKKADIGELPGQPFNTLLDEVLQPVDRDVFKREVKYYHAVVDGAKATSPVTPP